jgi:hypothetical protein
VIFRNHPRQPHPTRSQILAKSFRIRTSANSRICIKTNDFNLLRIPTSKLVQRTLKTRDFKVCRINTSTISRHNPFRIRTSKKDRGEGGGVRRQPHNSNERVIRYKMAFPHAPHVKSDELSHMESRPYTNTKPPGEGATRPWHSHSWLCSYDRNATRPDARWRTAPDCAGGLPLRRLPAAEEATAPGTCHETLAAVGSLATRHSPLHYANVKILTEGRP